MPFLFLSHPCAGDGVSGAGVGVGRATVPMTVGGMAATAAGALIYIVSAVSSRPGPLDGVTGDSAAFTDEVIETAAVGSYGSRMRLSRPAPRTNANNAQANAPMALRNVRFRFRICSFFASAFASTLLYISSLLFR